MPGKRTVPLPMKLAEEEKEELERIKEVEDRPLGYLARAFMLRGMAQYKLDGLLKDPGTSPKRLKVFVGRTMQKKPAKPAKRKAN